MKFLINEKKQTQCPECGKWVDMVHNETIDQYEIEHCRRKWCLFITKEKLENPEKAEVKKNKKIKKKK